MVNGQKVERDVRKNEHVGTGSKPEAKKRKLCICGFAPSTLYKAFELPDSEEWEFWGLNELYSVIGDKFKHFTRWFEMHNREYYPELDEKNPNGKIYIDTLRKFNIPIYMIEKYADIPNSVRFPIENIQQLLQTDYFTTTISYMIALAIYEGLQEAKGDLTKFKWESIALVGVDMAVGWATNKNTGLPEVANEYATQRPSVEFLLGYIKGLQLAGCPVKFYLPKEAGLLKLYSMYGYESAGDNQMKNDLYNQKKALEQMKGNLNSHLTALNGEFGKKAAEIQNSLIAVSAQSAQVDILLSNMNPFDYDRNEAIINKKGGSDDSGSLQETIGDCVQ